MSRFFDVQVGKPVTLARFLHDRLDENNLLEVAEELDRLASSAELHLDFQKVSMLTSAVLGKLVSLHRRITAAGGRLLLRNVSPFLRELFQVTRLETILHIESERVPTNVPA